MNTETPIKKIKTSKIIYVSPSDTMMKVEEIFESLPIHHILVLESETLPVSYTHLTLPTSDLV
mgnify:CR=1 FL=1